jgi:hypothetical protein
VEVCGSTTAAVASPLCLAKLTVSVNLLVPSAPDVNTNAYHYNKHVNILWLTDETIVEYKIDEYMSLYSSVLRNIKVYFSVTCNQ